MPGTADPVLGSGPMTLAVAALAGAAVAAAPVVLDPDSRAPVRILAGGLAYAVGCLAVWTLVRAVARPTTFGAYEPWALLGFALLGLAVLALQAAVPAYLYARWRVVSPLAGLFAATTLVLDLFFRVGGESDPLWLYALALGPILVAGLAAAGLLEAGVRRFGRAYGPDGPD